GSTLTGSCARAADALINTATNTADNETCFIFVLRLVYLHHHDRGSRSRFRPLRQVFRKKTSAKIAQRAHRTAGPQTTGPRQRSELRRNTEKLNTATRAGAE